MLVLLLLFPVLCVAVLVEFRCFGSGSGSLAVRLPSVASVVIVVVTSHVVNVMSSEEGRRKEDRMRRKPRNPTKE